MWIIGYIGGEYRILNGLIKGNCRFEVEIGEKCQIVAGSGLAGIQLIDDITPYNSESVSIAG